MAVTDIEEPLETGYGPAAPPGDNLCNDFQQETARSYAELAPARGDRVERTAGELTLTDAGLALPFWNRAVLEQPTFDAERTVSKLRSFYDDNGNHPFLLDSAWPTPDMRSFGYVLMGHPPLMLRPAATALPAPPSDLHIVRVDGSD